jgi:hypothetical protein
MSNARADSHILSSLALPTPRVSRGLPLSCKVCSAHLFKRGAVGLALKAVTNIGATG